MHTIANGYRSSMTSLKVRSLGICILLAWVTTGAFGQAENKTLACKARALSALKPLPELKYQCGPDEANDSDEKILSRPERISALNDLMRQLASFNGKEWWEITTGELNVCDFSGQPG